MRVNVTLIKWRRAHKGYYVLRLVKFLTKDKKTQMEKWMNENCRFKWNIYFSIFTGSYCAFENEIDAVAFKLRWV